MGVVVVGTASMQIDDDLGAKVKLCSTWEVKRLSDREPDRRSVIPCFGTHGGARGRLGSVWWK